MNALVLSSTLQAFRHQLVFTAFPEEYQTHLVDMFPTFDMCNSQKNKLKNNVNNHPEICS